MKARVPWFSARQIGDIIGALLVFVTLAGCIAIGWTIGLAAEATFGFGVCLGAIGMGSAVLLWATNSQENPS